MSLHNNGRPADLVAYTLATLPTPEDHVGSLIYVSDANGGQGAVAVARYNLFAGSPLGSPIAVISDADWDDISTYATVA